MDSENVRNRNDIQSQQVRRNSRSQGINEHRLNQSSGLYSEKNKWQAGPPEQRAASRRDDLRSVHGVSLLRPWKSYGVEALGATAHHLGKASEAVEIANVLASETHRGERKLRCQRAGLSHDSLTLPDWISKYDAKLPRIATPEVGQNMKFFFGWSSTALGYAPLLLMDRGGVVCPFAAKLHGNA